MHPFQHIHFPATREAAATRAYIHAQMNADFSEAQTFFTDDIHFNDIMFPVSGRAKVVESLSEYAHKFLQSYRVEAFSQPAPDRALLLHWIKVGKAPEQPVCDLLSFRDGLICRVDNCFNTANIQSNTT